MLDPDIEVETIRALRQEFGTAYPLRIDPNCAWSVDTSVEVGRALKEELSGGGYLEDPCASLEGMAEVRRRLLAEGIDTPLASNVAVTCFADVPAAKKLDAVQIVLSDPHYWGGLRQVQSLSHLCDVLGMGLSMHSNSHLGVSLMAMTHVAAASSASDLRLRYALPLADCAGRSGGRRTHSVHQRRRANSRPPGPRRGSRLRPACPRPRALPENPLSQARRRGGDAPPRRSELEKDFAALVESSDL